MTVDYGEGLISNLLTNIGVSDLFSKTETGSPSCHP
ncbi:hypothetical protein EAM_1111 [Erwinia amylovora ATCC 49946]|nr:hypothetical protein EAM_1111 [Erwinia amylovora ATCC 49946]